MEVGALRLLSAHANPLRSSGSSFQGSLRTLSCRPYFLFLVGWSRCGLRHKRDILTSMTRRELLALTAVLPLAEAEPKPSIIGKGWGLDHFIITLADSAFPKELYREKLGFTVLPGAKRPTGDENAVILLDPAYIELIFLYDRVRAEAAARDNVSVKRRLALVDRGGGPSAYNVDVSPIDQTVAALRARGMEVSLPPSQIVLRPDGTQVRGPWQFLRIDKTVEPPPPRGVPGGQAVGFLEYNENSSHAWMQKAREGTHAVDKRIKLGETHANTARKMRSVWVAVESAAIAVKDSELFGFPQIAELASNALGAHGREVQCGQGTIVFWEPAKGSALEGLITHRGFGPFGVSLGVADVNVAHNIVEEGTGEKFPMIKDGGSERFLVPPELTGGTCIDFCQS